MKLSTMFVAALVALTLVPGLAACGKKMAPTPPEDSKYPRQYPKPQ